MSWIIRAGARELGQELENWGMSWIIRPGARK